MATISFYREIRIPIENVDHFLDILEKPNESNNKGTSLDIDAELKKGNEKIKSLWLHRREYRRNNNKSGCQ